jgi:Helix-turn-helix domain
MTLEPPFLPCMCPPFPVLAHTFVLARSQLLACRHRRGWEWTLVSCLPQGPHHSSVVECTASGSLTLPPLSPLISKHTTKAGGGARVRRRAVAQMSLYYFSRLFKQSTGLSPHQYILQQRIARATRLLVKPQLSVAAIGNCVGFASPGHFTTIFRRWVGTTPWQYRLQR